jgi:amino-acid N-acetyltransferase
MAADDIHIEPAAPSDFDAMRTLIAEAALPLDGLEADRVSALVARDARGAVVGCAALEVYASEALLRSVAVSAARRGGGTGGLLLRHALELAARRAVQDVYLLTTTAAPFFASRGFEVVERADVPAAIRATGEFSSICPSSAIVMRNRLRSKTLD